MTGQTSHFDLPADPGEWTPGETAELIDWLRTEARELDELCRSMLAGYESFEQDDLENLKMVRLFIQYLKGKQNKLDTEAESETGNED